MKTSKNDFIIPVAIAAITFMLHITILVIGYFKLCNKIEKCSCKHGEEHTSSLVKSEIVRTEEGKNVITTAGVAKNEAKHGDDKFSCKRGESTLKPEIVAAGVGQKVAAMVQHPKKDDQDGDDESDTSSESSESSEGNRHPACQKPKTKPEVTYTSLVFPGKGQGADGMHKKKKFPDYINLDPEKAKLQPRTILRPERAESTDYAQVSEHV
ncbi:hypothetical protein NDU88_004626 [Pleurodeles waltl]|uniref:Uncharacterized protein n=1 Tax=Pleurodeles waltl TaxID=8319 RepID=A0AAV7QGE7_PLEWA|nr:hypothetical protein NDU88_004626 [Pleurodeles waltl]